MSGLTQQGQQCRKEEIQKRWQKFMLKQSQLHAKEELDLAQSHRLELLEEYRLFLIVGVVDNKIRGSR